MRTPRSPKALPPCCAPAAPWCRGIRRASTTQISATKASTARPCWPRRSRSTRTGGRRSDVDQSKFAPRQTPPHADGCDGRGHRHTQETINRKGVGFKGFIPAVFGRLINEGVRPPRGRLGRNEGRRRPRSSSATPRPKPTTGKAGDPRQAPAGVLAEGAAVSRRWRKPKARSPHRTAVPEYYGATCLSCHGSPQGEIDITGYPKEGGKEGDLGGGHQHHALQVGTLPCLLGRLPRPAEPCTFRPRPAKRAGASGRMAWLEK